MDRTISSTMQPLLVTLQRRRRLIIGLLLVFAGAYAVVAQAVSFSAAWDALRTGHWVWLVLAAGVWLASIVFAAGIYWVLANGRLHYWPTVLVQLVGSFASRAVPAGLGGVSVNYLYLRRQRARRGEAVATVAVNNCMGVLGHCLWLVIALLVAPWSTGFIRLPAWPGLWTGLAVVALLVILITMGIVLRQRLRRSWLQLVGQLASYWRQPWRLVSALVLSMALTASYAGALWLSAQAAGTPISAVIALLALTLAMLALSVTPTPGGLGGVEAGIVAVLVLSGQAAAPALVVAILFRLVTYWLPLVLGGLALVVALRRQLL